MVGAAIGLGADIVGNTIGIIGQRKNQKQTLRDLKAAEDNLKSVQGQGVSSTLTPEMQEAMNTALKNYAASLESAKTGFDTAQTAAYKSNINRNQTAQIQAAGEAGGGQMAGYVGAVASANKADNLLDMMSKDATLKLQKEQFAASQLNPVIGMSKGVQDVKETDTDRYNQLLREAGRAVSDLRMQRNTDRQGMYNSVGSTVKEVGNTVGNILGGGKKPQTNNASEFAPNANAMFQSDLGDVGTDYSSFFQ